MKNEEHIKIYYRLFFDLIGLIFVFFTTTALFIFFTSMAVYFLIINDISFSTVILAIFMFIVGLAFALSAVLYFIIIFYYIDFKVEINQSGIQKKNIFNRRKRVYNWDEIEEVYIDKISDYIGASTEMYVFKPYSKKTVSETIKIRKSDKTQAVVQKYVPSNVIKDRKYNSEEDLKRFVRDFIETIRNN